MMPISLCCSSFGVRFELIADSDVVLAKILAVAPFRTETCARTRDAGKKFSVLELPGSAGFQLLVDGDPVAESAESGAVLDQLGREVMVRVADQAPDRVFIHAGVVGWQGSALLLPGTSFAGKTTLVAELVRAGATYYSDEYAVLDEQGRVHPYSRELQMRQRGSCEQRPVAVDELSGSVGTEPLRISHVVFTEYVEGNRWSPQRTSAGMAVLEMMRHAIPVQRTPARVMAALAKVMETATALRSLRGEARETAGYLLAAMTAGGSQ